MKPIRMAVLTAALSLAGGAWAAAPTSSADINDLILKNSDLVPTWSQECLELFDIDNTGESPTLTLNASSTDVISFTYTSSEPVCLVIDNSGGPDYYLNTYVDEVTADSHATDTYVNNFYSAQPRMSTWYPAGTHKITFAVRDGNNNSTISKLPIRFKLIALLEQKELALDFLEGLHSKDFTFSIVDEPTARQHWIN